MSTITRERVTPIVPPVAEPDEVVILRRARELVERGWTKHGACKPVYDDAGALVGVRYCAFGAISVAARPGWAVPVRVMQLLRDALPHGSHVTAFNDSPPTTHRDVLDLFDRAIEAGLKGAS